MGTPNTPIKKETFFHEVSRVPRITCLDQIQVLPDSKALAPITMPHTASRRTKEGLGMWKQKVHLTAVLK